MPCVWGSNPVQPKRSTNALRLDLADEVARTEKVDPKHEGIAVRFRVLPGIVEVELKMHACRFVLVEDLAILDGVVGPLPEIPEHLRLGQRVRPRPQEEIVAHVPARRAERR
jgi:hypothetical protein